MRAFCIRNEYRYDSKFDRGPYSEAKCVATRQFIRVNKRQRGDGYDDNNTFRNDGHNNQNINVVQPVRDCVREGEMPMITSSTENIVTAEKM